MIQRPAAERYQLYSRGYTDGVCARNLRHEGDPDYEIGYSDGQADRAKRLIEYAKEVGHRPTILRSA